MENNDAEVENFVTLFVFSFGELMSNLLYFLKPYFEGISFWIFYTVCHFLLSVFSRATLRMIVVIWRSLATIEACWKNVLTYKGGCGGKGGKKN